MRSLFKRFSAWILRMILPEPVRTISIEEEVLEDISFMAKHAHPKEMLAFLSATKGIRKGNVVIDEIQIQSYVASVDSASVALHNLPTFSPIVGTVHSHPGGYVRPSSADLHLFSKFGFVHAIIGEPYEKNNVSFFDKNGRKISVVVLPSLLPENNPSRLRRRKL